MPAIAAILLLAAGLRFFGLSWGLRHTPHVDERYFVDSVGSMLYHGDLDHRFYEYPGLFLYLLAPVQALADPSGPGATAYLAGRGLVAAFGVLSVALVYVLGSRVAGDTAGVAAALLLAVSPVEVHTAHSIRPDVVLEAFVLATCLAIQRLGPALRTDALAGLAVGAATAVKFTGALLAPCYALAALLAPRPAGPGPWWAVATRISVGGLAALLAFVALSPYSVIHLPDAIEGARLQVAYHYVERGRGTQSFAGMAWTYGLILVKALGAAGVTLAAAGTALALRDGRRWASLVAFPLLVVAVFSTAEVNRDRQLVPALGLVAVLAGRAVGAVGRRSRAAALVVAGVAAVQPLAGSLDYVQGVSRPGTRDEALDWIEAHVPAGARILTSERDLGLDRARYEVVEAERLDAGMLPLAVDVDVVVSGDASADDGLLRELDVLHAAEPSNPHAGRRVLVAAASAHLRTAPRPLRLEPSQVSASESPESALLMVDGDLETAWRSAGPQRPGTWVQVELSPAAEVSRVSMRLAGRRDFPRNVHVLASGDGREWRRLRVFHARAPLEEQPPGGGANLVLVFEPVRVSALRLVQVGHRQRPWSVAELEVWAAPSRMPNGP